MKFFLFLIFFAFLSFFVDAKTMWGARRKKETEEDGQKFANKKKMKSLNKKDLPSNPFDFQQILDKMMNQISEIQEFISTPVFNSIYSELISNPEINQVVDLQSVLGGNDIEFVKTTALDSLTKLSIALQQLKISLKDPNTMQTIKENIPSEYHKLLDGINSGNIKIIKSFIEDFPNIPIDFKTLVLNLIDGKFSEAYNFFITLLQDPNTFDGIEDILNEIFNNSEFDEIAQNLGIPKENLQDKDGLLLLFKEGLEKIKNLDISALEEFGVPNILNV